MNEAAAVRNILNKHIDMLNIEIKKLEAREQFELCAGLLSVKKGLQYGVEACNLVEFSTAQEVSK